MRTELPDELELSSTVVAYEGARIALIEADGLFRLDAIVKTDVFQMFVRNFTSHPCAYEDVDPRIVGEHTTVFRLGQAGQPGAVRVEVTIAVDRKADTGIATLTTRARARRLDP